MPSESEAAAMRRMNRSVGSDEHADISTPSTMVRPLPLGRATSANATPKQTISGGKKRNHLPQQPELRRGESAPANPVTIRAQSTNTTATSSPVAASGTSNHNGAASLLSPIKTSRTSNKSGASIASKAKKTKKDEAEEERKRFYYLIIDEFTTTFLYTILSCLARGVVGTLVEFSNKSVASTTTLGKSSTTIAIMFYEIGQTLSFAVQWLLSWFPQNGTAPGFLFASSWVLLGWRRQKRTTTRSTYPLIPNLPIRISELMLGRHTLRDMAVIVPIHFSSSALAMMVVRQLARCVPYYPLRSSDVGHYALRPILYSEHNPWMLDCLSEVVFTSVFVVVMVVVPELCTLNRLPWSILPLLMMPLYKIAVVDSQGATSAFSPNIVYGLQLIQQHSKGTTSPSISNSPLTGLAVVQDDIPWRQSCHWIGPLIGGMVGGKILSIFFPDNEGS